MVARNQQPSYRGKARWQAWAEIPSGVTYFESISVVDIRRFMRKYPELREEEGDLINKYVIPFVLNLHKNTVLKSVRIMRLK